ncbi:hypothetical protein CVT24_007847 [Panaeolus cyanescens]|uniref:Lysine-specific metallo-endopeptidase domain-containing protein n=1 Tax=Panaeolus cyanescens TaxID=181874 RepID=A0A409VZF3_9AGAR|nr:hypothetical protein CVT24_007847 [Panaeolus cyanescens]
MFILQQHLSLLVLFWYASVFVSVQGTPVPVTIDPTSEAHLGNQPNYATLRARFELAQTLLANLYRIFSTPNLHRNHILHWAFGEVSPDDFDDIYRNIGVLYNPESYALISAVNEAPTTGASAMQGANAYTNFDEHGQATGLHFKTRFYTLVNQLDQAAIVIHELTHLFFDLYDCFLKDPPYTPTFLPVMEGNNYNGPDYIWGFEHKSLYFLTAHAPHVTKYNADSYAVAAIMAWRVKDMKTDKDIIKALKSGNAYTHTTLYDYLPRPQNKGARVGKAGSSSKGSSGKGKSSKKSKSS